MYNSRNICLGASIVKYFYCTYFIFSGEHFIARHIFLFVTTFSKEILELRGKKTSPVIHVNNEIVFLSTNNENAFLSKRESGD